jgi:hypothetical protein
MTFMDGNWMFGRLNDFRKTHNGGAVDADEIDFDFHEQYLNKPEGQDDAGGQDSDGEDHQAGMPLKKKAFGQGDALQKQLDTGIQIGEIEIHKVDDKKKNMEKREREDLK